MSMSTSSVVISSLSFRYKIRMKPKDKMHINSKICNFTTIGIGIVCIVFGFTLGLYADKVVSNLFHMELALTPSSPSHKYWIRTPVPLYLDVYLFNWTNAEEFAQNKATVPDFKEVGPFVFAEVHDRVGVVWNDNDTVTYNQSRKWTFIPEASEDLSVKITNLNVIGTTLSQQLKNFSRFKGVINWLFETERLANTATARKWIFDGIDDKLLEYISVLEHIFNIQTPKTKFAWFYGRNMSSSFDGTFTVHTGTDNIYKAGIMDRWNGMNKTCYFKNTCAAVNGTSGELFPPLKRKMRHLDIFVTDLCSTLKLYYNETSNMDGIDLYKFVGKEATFDNGQFSPEEKCNCINDKCIPYGARDGSTCKKAPVYFSFPHFYLSDESYRTQMTGMKPNESEHQFKILLDPVTGLPFEIKAQLQINVRLEPVPWLKTYSHVPEMYIPMMWFRQRATITPKLLHKVYMIHTFPQAIMGFAYGMLCVGLLIIFVRLYVAWRCKKDAEDVQLLVPPLPEEEENAPSSIISK